MSQWPKFSKIPKKTRSVVLNKAYLSLFPFFFPLGDERTGTEIKFSASHEKKKIRFQVFVRNAGGTKGQIFPPAAAVGAGPLLSRIGEHNPHTEEPHFSPASRNLTPPLSGDSLSAGLLSPLPTTLSARHEVPPAGTSVCHLPGLFFSPEGDRQVHTY